jgi:hypothetical protein
MDDDENIESGACELMAQKLDIDHPQNLKSYVRYSSSGMDMKHQTAFAYW